MTINFMVCLFVHSCGCVCVVCTYAYVLVCMCVCMCMFKFVWMCVEAIVQPWVSFLKGHTPCVFEIGS